MKSSVIKISLILLAVSAVSGAFGQAQPYQDEKYGVDSASRMECVKNISLYSEFYKQENFKDAVIPWRYVYINCPLASKNTFLRGSTIYKNLIVNEKDEAKKNALIDTLMMIYDKRIEFYGDEGLVLSYKGADLYSYKGEKAALETSEILKKALTLEGKEVKAAVVTTYMQAVVDLYRLKQIDETAVIDAYTLSGKTLDLATAYNKSIVDQGGTNGEKGKKELEVIATTGSNIDALLSDSGAADCDALAGIFEPKFDENMNNVEWLKRATYVLDKYNCTEKEIFAKAAEQLNKLEPSAEASHNLARLFLKREEFDKASEYYAKATELQTDITVKALYYYEWSTLAMAKENYPKVRELSMQALALNPNDGRPYLMIGRAYAASKGIGKEKVEQNAVFWVAIDKFVQAKKVDSSLASQADELINTYSKYYPNFEEWFMAVGTKEGDSYTVGGWINETTRVRF